MRTSIALGVILFLGLSMQARAQKPGIFGTRKFPTAGPTETADANKFPIPQQSTSLFSKLSNLIPARFTAPFGQPAIPQSVIPSYSPLMPKSYLKAFHFLPPRTASQ
jgi:hypothetical protein